MSQKISDFLRPGVVTGDDVQKVFAPAKKDEFALPAVNVVGTDSINAVMEAAAAVNSPVIIQFSNGGASFYAGKGLGNENERAAILGAVSGARHVHELAEAYGIPVICIRIMPPESSFRGSTVCSKPERYTTENTESLFSLPICLIFPKNLWI